MFCFNGKPRSSTVALKVVRISCHPMEGPYSGSERPHLRLDGPHVRIASRHTPCEGPHFRIASCHTPCEGPHVRIASRHMPCEGPHFRIAGAIAMRGSALPHRQSPCEGPHVCIASRHARVRTHTSASPVAIRHARVRTSTSPVAIIYAMRGAARPHRQSPHWSTAYYNTSSSFSTFCHQKSNIFTY